jgi:hypothetical protein
VEGFLYLLDPEQFLPLSEKAISYEGSIGFFKQNSETK